LNAASFRFLTDVGLKVWSCHVFQFVGVPYLHTKLSMLMNILRFSLLFLMCVS
jgi:hypothetical protein